MTHSLDFRRHVLSVRKKEKLTIEQTAQRFCIGVASITRWLKNIEPQTKRNKPATKIDMRALEEDVERYPDAFQYERAKRLGVSEKGIGHALRRMGVSYKKNIGPSKGGRRRTTVLSKADQ